MPGIKERRTAEATISMNPMSSKRNGSTEEATVSVNSIKQIGVRVAASSAVPSNTCKANAIYQDEGVSDEGERPNAKKTVNVKKQKRKGSVIPRTLEIKIFKLTCLSSFPQRTNCLYINDQI